MLDRSKVVQLIRIEQHLSDFGAYAIESEVKGVTYGYWKDHLVIFTLSGDIAIRHEDIPDLIKWLKSIHKTGYIPLNMPICFGMRNNRIVISGDGEMTIFKSRMPEFINELEGIYQDLTWRKNAGIKGA